MLDFLTPEFFNTLVWSVIAIGGALALWRLIRDLTGPPRWPEDDDDLIEPPGRQDGEPRT